MLKSNSLKVNKNTFSKTLLFSQDKVAKCFMTYKSIRSNSTANDNCSSYIGKRRFSSPSKNQEVSTILRVDMSASTLAATFEQAIKLFSNRDAVGTYNIETGKYEWVTYKDLGNLVNNFKKVLHAHNIEVGNKISIISNNRLEWIVVAYAAFSLGAQIVPMYEVQLEKDWKYIIENSDSKLLIVANEKIFNKVKGYVGQVGKLQSVLSFDSPPEQINSYARWMTLAKNEKDLPKENITEDDIAVIIYTSGTTGNPKGVELSHKNILSVMRGVSKKLGDDIYNHNALMILPWAHVFGQSDLHSLLAVGSSLSLVPNRELILPCLRATKPTMITAVPALLNKVYDGVRKQIDDSPSKFKKAIFTWAINVSKRRISLLSSHQSVGFLLDLQFKIADALVFKKIRDALGGRLRFFGLGGAATSIPVLYFFEGLGIPCLEGYGLTETSPVISSGGLSWTQRKLGFVGKAIDGVTVKIIDPGTLEDIPVDQEGEITVTGPSVMVGYRKNPSANEAVFFVKDGQRYFRTGDLGKLDKDGFLKVTGRIKEQYKLENGKYVVPTPIEDTLVRSLFIAQAMVYGDNKQFNVALIVPDLAEIKTWCEKNGIKVSPDTNNEIYKHESVINLLKNEISQVSLVMKSYERPHSFAIIEEPFSQDNQMLTPKMSLRRTNILKTYQHLIDGLYAGKVGYIISSNKNKGNVGDSQP